MRECYNEEPHQALVEEKPVMMSDVDDDTVFRSSELGGVCCSYYVVDGIIESRSKFRWREAQGALCKAGRDRKEQMVLRHREDVEA